MNWIIFNYNIAFNEYFITRKLATLVLNTYINCAALSKSNRCTHAARIIHTFFQCNGTTIFTGSKCTMTIANMRTPIFNNNHTTIRYYRRYIFIVFWEYTYHIITVSYKICIISIRSGISRIYHHIRHYKSSNRQCHS